MNDAELVQQTLAGEVESFGRLVDRHRGAVQALAYHRIGHFEDAEDIAQESFVTAYLKLRQLRQPECFAAWLRQLTLNYCRKWMKKQRATIPFEEIEASTAGSEPSPVELLEENEARRLVHCSLQKLGENNRLVVSLHYLGAMSYEEIARFLDLPLTTVRGRVHRAKKQLKGHLMQTIEDTLRGEQLDDDFTRKVLEQARKRVREARQQWHREDFVLSCHKGLEAAEQLADAQAQIEMLTLLGEAGATWMGEQESAVENYEKALDLARQQDNAEEEASLLRALYEAHVRHGEWEKLRQRAQETLDVGPSRRDGINQAQAQAALDLAENLPGAWQPDQAGGYAIAAFPIEVGTEGYSWRDPVAVRNYSWGCPSRCAALIHLFRPRRFLGPSLELGAQWEDRLDHQQDRMSWGIEAADPEPVARSQVESIDDLVATPAGRFERCLRVKTEIAAPGGGIATEHRTRSYCGVRIAWFAPGVGLVKLRHRDQNATAWTVYLTAHEGPQSNDFFPLTAGHVWRYRWVESWSPPHAFEDVCRVVGDGDGAIHLSSATWGIEQSEEEELRHYEQQLELERAAGDLEEQAILLEQIVGRCQDEQRSRICRRQLIALYEQQLELERASGNLEGQAMALERIAGHCQDEQRSLACGQQILAICRPLGDEWGLLEVGQALQRKQEGLSPAEEEEWLDQRLELARRLGDPGKEIATLHELAHHHLENGECETAALFFEEHAAALGEEGDIRKAAHSISQAELVRAIRDRAEDPHCAYRHGTGYLKEEEGVLTGLGSSRSNHSEQYPPILLTTPMSDFLWLGPFDGIELLGLKVGESCTGWHNASVGGICESMRVTSRLKSKEEAVEVQTGPFSGCALIETTISTSAESRPLDDEDLEKARGYFAGVKEVWFAPGAGVVKLCYHHHNGFVTEVELLDHQLTAPSDRYFPLALDNRWRYGWTDQESSTRFEDFLRVASHREGQWNFAFAIRAESRGEKGVA